ncbi:hypothetical protein [Aequorivita sp. Q41]|uniref:hypothetical protein n=1 Tax=Aequorivita sp. Q41 TaxID=3153300 RepID=UPI00324211BF
MKLIIYNIIVVVVQATSDNSGPPPPPDQNRPPLVPIDDNLWVILVIGLVFGVYIAYKKMQAIHKAA